MNEERGDGESVGSEALSLLSYTLRYVGLTDLGRHGDSWSSSVSVSESESENDSD